MVAGVFAQPIQVALQLPMQQPAVSNPHQPLRTPHSPEGCSLQHGEDVRLRYRSDLVDDDGGWGAHGREQFAEFAPRRCHLRRPHEQSAPLSLSVTAPVTVTSNVPCHCHCPRSSPKVSLAPPTRAADTILHTACRRGGSSGMDGWMRQGRLLSLRTAGLTATTNEGCSTH